MELSDLDFLQELIDTPEPPKSTRTRKKQDIRDIKTWFGLVHINSRCLDCQGINCVERGFQGDDLNFPDHCLSCGSHNVTTTGKCSQGDECLGIAYGKGPERVTALVNGIEMCRYDFLDGLAYQPDD